MIHHTHNNKECRSSSQHIRVRHDHSPSSVCTQREEEEWRKKANNRESKKDENEALPAKSLQNHYIAILISWAFFCSFFCNRQESFEQSRTASPWFRVRSLTREKLVSFLHAKMIRARRTSVLIHVEVLVSSSLWCVRRVSGMKLDEIETTWDLYVEPSNRWILCFASVLLCLNSTHARGQDKRNPESTIQFRNFESEAFESVDPNALRESSKPCLQYWTPGSRVFKTNPTQ